MSSALLPRENWAEQCHGAALSTGLCCREPDFIFQLSQGVQAKDFLESCCDLLLCCRPGE